LRNLLEALVFDVASYRGLPDISVWRMPVSWLFAEYERVQRARWGQFVDRAMSTEIGVSRGVAVALSDSKKKVSLPPLPTWDEVQKQADEARRAVKRPAWFEAYEQANRRQEREKDETEG